MSTARSVPKVAIACQGGGIHSAFVAGVLLQLFGSEFRTRFDLVALSGASGGGFSAALLWRGLVNSGADEGMERLAGFWRELQARDPADAFVSFADVWLARTPGVVNIPPYLGQFFARPRLRGAIRRHLALEDLTTDRARRAHPKLFIGATDVENGARVVFEGESLSYDQLLASAAVPPLFRSVEVVGRRCWDGLFTINPPVRELTDLVERPDEIWVVQVNSQLRREPRSMREIKDRSNEISGNLSLGQELYFIDKINDLLERHDSLRAEYRPIRVRVVELDGECLDFASKLDRRSGFIEGLILAGKERAERFFDARSSWPRDRTPPAKSVFVG